MRNWKAENRKAKLVSFSGIPFEEAVSDLLKVKPSPKGKEATRKKKPKKK